MRTEIRLAGAGGQGLITAAVILAEAAGLGEGHFVSQTQSYGPEARGGASRADVVISDTPIHYPKTRKTDILLALTQEACDRYSRNLKDGGILIADADGVGASPTPGTVKLPLLRTVREAFGHETYVSSAVLGAVCAMTGIVGKRHLKAALKKRVPAKMVEENLKAFDLGEALGKEGKKKAPTGSGVEADM